MNITMKATCWDGVRRHSLNSKVVEIAEIKPTWKDKIKEAGKRLNDPAVKSIIGFAVPILLLTHGLPPIGIPMALAAAIEPESAPAMAIPAGVKETILHAFDPLIDLIQSLAFPIAGVMIAGGCLFIMVGNRDRGMQMLQNAAIGYILVQLSPMLLKLLVGIGQSV